ncbi:glycosyltransferase family 2 protein [Desulfovibrio litoralis]|uniref:Glycosyltransferase, GT2 family n=1 Tax=Desulfovibrio litoralis DSM 11393 TaxID=1121455 RepID=A0A1M7SRY1_9BACT|nr:glycosyltransferase [Desulfovibrio litoralis]SHN61164.1 Glycosyltransferase, GT2 family [Desulfovibrio litoralis DSM 11393]
MPLPVVNITIPVFNRFHLTQKTILSLRRCSQRIPFVITVVDNGSEPDLAQRLVEFYKDGIIDHLFRLPENMGISCAANIGWQLVEAPFYMKLDNDIQILDPEWLIKLFRLWSHGQPLSTLSPVWLNGAVLSDLSSVCEDDKKLFEHAQSIHTPDGILGFCETNGAGAGILIPKALSDVLGLWNEDYGLYGAEDGDYGLRMVCSGFPQYLYLATGLTEHLGAVSNESWEVDRKKEHRNLFIDPQGGLGLFKINHYLYSQHIRTCKVPLRYEVVDIDSNNAVRLAEREEYLRVRKALTKCKYLLDKQVDEKGKYAIFDPEFVALLKNIMARCGQSCS